MSEAVSLRTTSVTAVAVLIAASMLVLPFILNNIQPPVATFHSEWLAAALGVLAALSQLCSPGTRIRPLPGPAWWALAFALFLALQARIVPAAYVQIPMLGVLFASYAALMIWLGAQISHSGGERTVRTLATCLLAGALINAAAGVIQFYGRPAFLEDWILPMRGGRALGNVGQINLYANYLALGEAALLFLWLQRKVSTVWAVVTAVLLAYASALSGTRSALLFLVWMAALGFYASRSLRRADDTLATRLVSASVALASAALIIHVAAPRIHEFLMSYSSSPGSVERLMALGAYAEPRWQAWLLAWQIFLGAPFFGIGIGQFASAAFQAGLDPDLSGFIWSSPHNLVLHLLAETGLIGTALALGCLIAWWVHVVRSHRRKPELATWLLMALVGIETLHSMVEFPLWNAQFLGLTCLLMGLGTERDAETMKAPAIWRTRAMVATISVLLAGGLAALMRDYMRFDATRVTGTRFTLAPAEEKTRAARIMRELAVGPLAPLAEGWMLLGTDLDRNDLADKLAASARVVRYWPGSDMLARRAALLALNGQPEEASQVMALAVRAFPSRCEVMELALRQAAEADQDAIKPLLAQVRASTQNCS